MALADRLLSLGNEIEHQYQIVYARPSRLIPPKTMEVTVEEAGGYSPRTTVAVTNASTATAAPTMASAA